MRIPLATALFLISLAPFLAPVLAADVTSTASLETRRASLETRRASLQTRRASLETSQATCEQLSAEFRELALQYADRCDFEAARKLAQEDIELREKFGPDGLPESWIVLGNIDRLAGHYQGARESIMRGLTRLQAARPPDSTRLAAAFNYLALLENNAGNFSQSEDAARKALALSKQEKLGEANAAMHSVVLANALRQQGKFEEAAQLLEAAVPVLKRTDADRGLLGTAVNNLGAIYFWRGDFQQALTTLNEGLQIRLRTKGSNHPDVANSYIDLACTEFKLGETEKARRDASKAVEIRDKSLGRNHPETLAAMSNLAVILEATGDGAGALKVLEEVVPAAQVALGSDHPDLAQYQDNYANLLATQKQFDRARKAQASSLSIRRTAFGADSREYAAGLRSLAQIETAAGNGTTAVCLLKQSADVYAAKGLNPDQDYADTLDALAALYVERKELMSARDALLKAMNARKEGGPTVAYAVTCANLSEVQGKMGHREESDKTLRLAKSIVESLPKSQRSHPDCALILDRFRKSTSVRQQ